MKPPEEIKRGMKYLSIKDITQKMDMWKEGIAYDYVEDVATDGLSYIQQLEQDNAQKDERIRNLERERDQALHDMRNIYGSICLVCKNFYRPDKTVLKFACKEFGELRNHGSTVFCGKFEWRGVEEEERWNASVADAS